MTDNTDLLDKGAICRLKGWSNRFFDSLAMPYYPIGKRKYYRLCDVEPHLMSMKEEAKWASSKSKARRISISPSRSKVVGIEEARRRIKERMQKPSMETNGERRF